MDRFWGTWGDEPQDEPEATAGTKALAAALFLCVIVACALALNAAW